MTDDVYITVSLERGHDQPVADIAYRGVQWASLVLRDGEAMLTLYADEESRAIPVAVAVESINEAERRLRQLD